MDTGLDSFILTKPFTGKRWTYPLISELEIHSVGKRTVSSKTLADVTLVEALIGAAFLDGGLSAARGCTHTFLPDIRTPSLVFGSSAHPRSAKLVSSSIDMMAELLINHQFLDKDLLQEALTHPSRWALAPLFKAKAVNSNSTSNSSFYFTGLLYFSSISSSTAVLSQSKSHRQGMPVFFSTRDKVRRLGVGITSVEESML